MKILLLPSLVVSTFVLNAQAPVPSARAVFVSEGKRLLMSGQPSHSGTAGKNTAIKYRLSKQEEFNYFRTQNALTDSARFIYSGSRGSRPISGDVGYIDIFNLGYAPSTDFRYEPPTPNGNDSVLLPQVAFDTLLHYSVDIFEGPLRFKNRETRIYNGDGSVNTTTTSNYDQAGGIVGGHRQVVSYNAGSISKVYCMTPNGAVYDTFSLRTVGYDSYNQPIFESIATKKAGVFQAERRTHYTYNGIGRLTSTILELYNAATSSFDSVYRLTHTYLPSGDVLTTTREQVSALGMPLELTQIDSFGYTPGVAGFTSTHTRGYFPNGSLASYNKLVTNHFASNGLKDSMTYSDVLKGLDLFGYKINYNTQGDPVASHGYDVQTSQAIEIYTTKYYYEAYGTNVGIEKASLSGSHVSLFPNPVSGHFTLSLPDAKPGSAISVRITNTSGQLVHAERFTMQGTSRQIILEDEAAPGTYYLSVYDEQGRPIGNRSFLKL